MNIFYYFWTTQTTPLHWGAGDFKKLLLDTYEIDQRQLVLSPMAGLWFGIVFNEALLHYSTCMCNPFKRLWAWWSLMEHGAKCYACKAIHHKKSLNLFLSLKKTVQKLSSIHSSSVLTETCSMMPKPMRTLELHNNKIITFSCNYLVQYHRPY